MNELIPAYKKWKEQGLSMALATVVKTWGSSPRGVGSKMLVNLKGEMAGSVSGGCVEGAVVAAAREVLETDIPQMLHFGVADETAWEVGLACGGEIEVFVRPLGLTAFEALRTAWHKGQKIANAVVIQGSKQILGQEMVLLDDGKFHGKFAHSQIDALENLLQITLENGQPMRHTLNPQPENLKQPFELFLDVILPPSTLVIVGGVHIAIPLVTLANTLGYQTVVIDPRRQFGNRERFPNADQVIASWPGAAFSQVPPNASTAVAMLTHDPKIDDPALKIVLKSPAFYVGALGSKKTQSQRRGRLLEMGLSEEQVNRIHGPIGLNLGGRSPEEIALAIMAEIVQTNNQ
jgi:xanthine dehydrogenase accessory factor